MKKPIEYLGNVTSFTTREELYEIGRQIQVDSVLYVINKTLEFIENENDKLSYVAFINNRLKSELELRNDNT